MSDEMGKILMMFEEMKRDIKAIAEGHSVLLNAIGEMDSRLSQRIDDLSMVTKEIGRDLRVHFRQTVPPAHVGV